VDRLNLLNVTCNLDKSHSSIEHENYFEGLMLHGNHLEFEEKFLYNKRECFKGIFEIFGTQSERDRCFQRKISY
jgi:hypothetical protein